MAGKSRLALDRHTLEIKPHRVLFVCKGNICRSPMAEGLFRFAAGRAGRLEEFDVDSAGTSGWHFGQRPDRRAISVAKRRGVDLNQLRGRTLTQADYTRFDLILAMDRFNLRSIERRRPASARAQVALLMSYAPHFGVDEIQDPYFGRIDGFEKTFALINAAIKELLRTLPNP